MKPYRETEHGIQQGIMDYLQTVGWLVWRNNSGTVRTINNTWVKMGVAGLPDVFAIKNGILLGVEVKRASGKTTEAQDRMHKELRDHGAIVLVARCIEDVEDLVKTL